MNIFNEEIMEHLDKSNAFDKMYQIIRIVDPINKETKIDGETGVLEQVGKCFEFWIHNKICDNCTAMRAFNENDVFIKLEYVDDYIFMITVIPVQIQNNKVVVELLKDVTNSMIFRDEKNDMNIKVKELIDQFNIVSFTDALTGIFNKRFIHERLPVEITLREIRDKPLSIIMADLDFFKRINDNYEHMAGDFILKEFTHLLVSHIRKGKDWVSRFGGEEFLICLPDTDKDKAISVAERMRKAMEDSVFKYKEETISLTASFGVCTLEKGDRNDMEKFINCADTRLYKAKQNGRNSVEG